MEYVQECVKLNRVPAFKLYCCTLLSRTLKIGNGIITSALSKLKRELMDVDSCLKSQRRRLRQHCREFESNWSYILWSKTGWPTELRIPSGGGREKCKPTTSALGKWRHGSKAEIQGHPPLHSKFKAQNGAFISTKTTNTPNKKRHIFLSQFPVSSKCTHTRNFWVTSHLQEIWCVYSCMS